MECQCKGRGVSCRWCGIEFVDGALMEHVQRAHPEELHDALGKSDTIVGYLRHGPGIALLPKE
jgi:hypothetical protein